MRIEAADRAGCLRLLRYCARPPFALDRLRELDPERLVYDPPKRGPGGTGPLRLTPLELLDRLAALVPPPRVHRHRYFGVLAPNSPLRTAVTALAPGASTAPPAPIAQPATEPAPRRAARHTWALLLARIYDRRKSLWDDVFPLLGPWCGSELRIPLERSELPLVTQRSVQERSTGSPALFHSGKPSSSRRALRPRLRNSATASNAIRQYGPRQ